MESSYPPTDVPTPADAEQEPRALTRFGRILRRARERRSLSLINVAEQLGTTHQRLQRIEAGKSDPSLAFVVRLALLFDLDLNVVVFGQKVYAPLRQAKEGDAA